MRGSLFPDGVLVDRTALRRTEVSKSEEIKRDRNDLSSRGMLSGGAVTVNATDNTRIDVAQLSGYAPNGEFIETTSDYYSIALSDYTSGAVNLLCAVYSETNVGYQPHESDGQRYPTEARVAWRIKVFTEAEFAALAVTDDNLANNAQDRCLLIAKITGNGTGVALTTSNIFSPSVYSDILYAVPETLVSITGVTVQGVDPDTATGDGTLHLDVSAAPTYKFQWESAGVGTGAQVSVTVDGNYNILDANGDYLTINVVVSQLPLTNQSETLTIYNLYHQSIPRFTGEDLLHRSKLGTGVVNENNPHGLSVNDIEGAAAESALEEHQDVMHCNGIWRGSYSQTLSASLVINTPPGGDTLNIQAPISGDLFYVNGRKLSAILSTSFYFTPANFTAGVFGPTVKEGSKLYEVYVDDEGELVINLRADTNPTVSPPRGVTGCWIVDMSDDHPAGDYDLVCTVSGDDYTLSWGLSGGAQGQSVTFDHGTFWTDPEGQIIRLYDATGVNWIDLYVNRSNAGTGPDAKLPASSQTDTIVVRSPLDSDQNMKILSILYWYDTSRGTLGWETDFTGGTGQRHTIDKRSWGTLCVSDIADAAMESLEYQANDELHLSGILFARNAENGSFVSLADTTGLDFPVTGGSYYFRGQRLDCEGATALSVQDDTTSLVYINASGSITSMDVGAGSDFGGDVSKALAWLLGSTYERSAQSDAGYVYGAGPYLEKGVPLYLVTAASGNIVDWIDVSRNVNGAVDPWSVGARRSYVWPTTPIDLTQTYLAAFDSVEAAFLHAEAVSGDLDPAQNTEVSLIGDSYVFSGRSVTQPANSIVRGVKRDITVTVDQISSSGAWLLTSGGEVSNFTVSPSITASLNDGYAFKLGSDCVIKDISLSAVLGSSNGFAVAGYDFAVDLDRVRIDGCEFSTDGRILYVVGLGETYTLDITDMVVRGNRFLCETPSYMVSSSSQSFFCLRAATNARLVFEDNYVVADGDPSTTTEPISAVRIYPAADSRIIGNTVFAKTDGEGMELWSVHNSEVNGNFVAGYTTTPDYNPSTPTSSVDGINFSGNFTKFVRNEVVDCFDGIRVSGGSVHGSVFSDNIIRAFSGSGIHLYTSSVDTFGRSNTISAIRVAGNLISGGVRLSSMTDSLRGIYFQCIVPSGLTLIEGVEVVGNTISDLYNDIDPDGVCGIWFRLSEVSGATPDARNVTISGNKISGIESGNASYDAHGIDVYVEDDISLYNLSIDGNIVSFADSTVGPTVGVNLYRESTLDADEGCTVSGNNIDSVVSSNSMDSTGVSLSGGKLSSISRNNIRAGNVGVLVDSIDSDVSENTILSYFRGIVFAKVEPHTGLRAKCNNITIKQSALRTYLGQGTGGGVCILEDVGHTEVVGNAIYIAGSSFDTNVHGVWVEGSNYGFVIDGNCIRLVCNVSGSYTTMGVLVGFNFKNHISICNNTIDGSTGNVACTGGIYIGGSDSTANAFSAIVAGNVVSVPGQSSASTAPWSLAVGSAGLSADKMLFNGNVLRVSDGGSPNKYNSVSFGSLYTASALTSTRDSWNGSSVYSTTLF